MKSAMSAPACLFGYSPRGIPRAHPARRQVPMKRNSFLIVVWEAGGRISKFWTYTHTHTHTHTHIQTQVHTRERNQANGRHHPSSETNFESDVPQRWNSSKKRVRRPFCCCLATTRFRITTGPPPIANQSSHQSRIFFFAPISFFPVGSATTRRLDRSIRLLSIRRRKPFCVFRLLFCRSSGSSMSFYVGVVLFFFDTTHRNENKTTWEIFSSWIVTCKKWRPFVTCAGFSFLIRRRKGCSHGRRGEIKGNDPTASWVSTAIAMNEWASSPPIRLFGVFSAAFYCGTDTRFIRATLTKYPLAMPTSDWISFLIGTHFGTAAVFICFPNTHFHFVSNIPWYYFIFLVGLAWTIHWVTTGGSFFIVDTLIPSSDFKERTSPCSTDTAVAFSLWWNAYQYGMFVYR